MTNTLSSNALKSVLDEGNRSLYWSLHLVLGLRHKD